MTDTATDTPTADDAPTEEQAPVEAPVDGADSEEDGAGSKRAVLADLARERKARKAAEQELKKFQEANQTEAEKAIAAAKAEGERFASEKHRKQIIRSEIKAAAAGLLVNPDIATRLIDITQFDVNEDGEVDSEAIKAELQRLVKDEPYLAAGAKPTALPGGGATPSQGFSMDDLIRRKARGH